MGEYGPIASLVLVLMPWATVSLLAHAVWVLIAFGNVRLAFAELVMGLIGNAVVCHLFLGFIGDPVPLSVLMKAQFAGFGLALDLVRGLGGSGS